MWVSYTKSAQGNHIWTDIITKDTTLPLSEKVLQFANPFWGSFPKIASYEAWKMNDAAYPDQLAVHLTHVKGDNSILMLYVLLTSTQAAYDQYLKSIERSSRIGYNKDVSCGSVLISYYMEVKQWIVI